MMKKTGKLFVSMATLGILLNNVAYASTEEGEKSLPTKYIFMGIAALVILLLLFLGYKMDTKGNDVSAPKKVSHKAEKTKQKLSAKAEALKENSGTYEADEEAYEADGEIFNNDDLNDSVEYKEDELEDSLFSTEENDDYDYENGTGFGSVPVEEESEITTNAVEEPVEKEEPEATGEEFDTSIIDGLEDEDDNTEKSSFDNTMLFNSNDFSSTGNSLEDEIDSLDNDSGTDDIELITDDKNDDKFIEELKNYEKPKDDFEGFSVAPKKEEKLEEFIEANEEKKPKKYTKVSKIEESEEVEKEPIDTSFGMDNDFLSQMEANLQKNHDERVAKKETKDTTKKKTNKNED